MRKFNKFNKLKLNYGEYGGYMLRPYYLYLKVYLNFLRIIRLSCKRAKKNLRFFWVYMIISMPFIRKGKGSRMGKGKGSQSTYFGYIKNGTVLFEMRGMRLGRFLKFFRKANHYLGNNIDWFGSKYNFRLISRFRVSETRGGSYFY